MNNDKKVGSRLRRLRKHRKLTQTELGKKTDFSQSAIGNFENGVRQINSDALETFSTELDVPLWLLKDGVPEDAIKAGYTLDFFADADEQQMRDFSSEMQQRNQEDYEVSLGQTKDRIDLYTYELASLFMDKELDQLEDFVDMQRQGIIDRTRVKKVVNGEDPKKAVKYDPFRKIEIENNEIKSKHYHLFLDGTLHDLNKIINGLDEDSPIKKPLHDILIKLSNRENMRNFPS